MPPARDTIFALSSGRPPAAIAVVRISGPMAGHALRSVIGRVPEPRRAALVRVRDPASGEIIDEAVALWFPGPHSETGEDIAELQLHGGRAVIAGVLRALGQIEGLRPAEAGEFTRRAFENGRLDLTAVEGLADLIYAETEAQRRQAYRQLKGLLGDRAESWRGRLIEALALVEAGIDFSDEADVPQDLLDPALAMVRSLRDEIASALAGAGRGERLREGLVVAIAGPPNAGKSTLLNRIAKREAAIVSPVAGTTRDVIEVHLDLDGYPVTMLDTAGIRESDDPVEQEGVRRARERAEGADLVLWVVDAREHSEVPPAPPPSSGGATWTILNKADLLPSAQKPDHGWSLESDRTVRPSTEGTPRPSHEGRTAGPANDGRGSERVAVTVPGPGFVISATTGEGMNQLLNHVSDHAREFFGSGSALVSRERHRLLLGETLSALERALAAQGREDILAEELRVASRALGRLTGRVDVEDVLDVIFRDFCIGK